jgi:hypothetical protein
MVWRNGISVILTSVVALQAWVHSGGNGLQVQGLFFFCLSAVGPVRSPDRRLRNNRWILLRLYAWAGVRCFFCKDNSEGDDNSQLPGVQYWLRSFVPEFN